MASALRCIAQFPNPTAAALYLSVLESHGIPALLRNDNMATLGYPGMNPVGVELLVNEDDVDRASEVLKQGVDSTDVDDTSAHLPDQETDNLPYE